MKYIVKDTSQDEELFLCSTDIRVGDKVICNGHEDMVLEYPYTDPYGDGYDILLKEEGTQVVGYDILRVIGKVSKDAIWIKEGHEFTDTDLNFLAYYKKHPMESMNSNNLEEVQEFINQHPDRYKCIVQFRCPTCGTFH